MKKSKRLSVLIKIEEANEREEARKFSGYQKVVQENRKKLSDLQGYLNEYQDMFTQLSTRGTEADKIRSCYAFISQLNAAISQQQKVVGEAERAAEEYFAPHIEPGIFPEMRELVLRLQQQGCLAWAVSSSNQWIIRVAMRRFGIPPHRILAAEVAIEGGVITDRLVRIPTGPGKAKAIREKIGERVDAAFGNSRWDAEMLQLAKHPFAINPTSEFEQFARQNKWTVYFPDSAGNL